MSSFSSGVISAPSNEIDYLSIRAIKSEMDAPLYGSKGALPNII